MSGDSMTAPDALAALRDRFPDAARVYVAGCAGEPLEAARAFARDPARAAGLTFLGIWVPGVNTTDYAGLHEAAASELIFLAPEFRASFEERRAVLRPLSYMQAWDWLERGPIDAAIVQTTAPDARGEVSLGVSADFSPAVLARQDVFTIAEINPQAPRPPSAPSYPLDLFDLSYRAAIPPLRYEPPPPAPVFAAIARNVARLIGDGDTLQTGLGNVQPALFPALRDRRRLRVHSGMAMEPVAKAIDAGIISDEDGAATIGVALGPAGFHARAAGDRRFRFQPVAQTHALPTLAAIDNFVAVNSVVEVDLFGQANAEFINGRQISGGGGLGDFLLGAAASKGGRPILALASTARDGTISRITPRLTAPCATLARTDVAIVVTEHGVADLRGATVDERARALIAIAHPDHRRALAAAWDALSREI